MITGSEWHGLEGDQMHEECLQRDSWTGLVAPCQVCLLCLHESTVQWQSVESLDIVHIDNAKLNMVCSFSLSPHR